MPRDEGYTDLAVDGEVVIPLEDWLRDEATLPEGSFVALADGEIVGYSGLMRHDNAGVAEDGLTVVARDWRRRGLAMALKRLELAWAAENGFREVVTWTQRGNEGMRDVNERLGYEYRTVALKMMASLPLGDPVTLRRAEADRRGGLRRSPIASASGWRGSRGIRGSASSTSWQTAFRRALASSISAAGTARRPPASPTGST